MRTAKGESAGGLTSLGMTDADASRMLSLPEQIASRIGDRILSGDIAPGARITELAMVDEFGVSRAPIREAFRILEQERLIRIHPRRGVTVTLLTREDLGEIFEIIINLFRIVGQKLAEVRSPEAIRLLQETLPVLDKAAREPNQIDADPALGYRLGLRLVHAAGNSRIEEILRALALESFRYRRLAYQSTAHRQKTMARWRALLKAIQKGNGSAAADAIGGIVEGNRDAALRILSEEIETST
jgi:DNA-binding GntR family transcriptional regulator